MPSDSNDLFDLNTAALAGYGDVRDAVATFNGASTIAGGLFDTAPLSLSMVGGEVDWTVNFGNGDGPPQTGTPFESNVTPIAGHSSLNTGTGNGSLVGNLLTIPISVNAPITLGGVPVDVIFTGQIVARAVPSHRHWSSPP